MTYPEVGAEEGGRASVDWLVFGKLGVCRLGRGLLRFARNDTGGSRKVFGEGFVGEESVDFDVG
jgi:hypothetical protein